MDNLHILQKKMFFIAALLLIFAVNSAVIFEGIGTTTHKEDGTVLSADINVTAFVDNPTVNSDPNCIANIIAIPEKRAVTNDLSTDLTVDVYDDDTYMGTFTTTTNSNGEATVNLCGQGLTLGSNYYDYDVIGFSHLRRSVDNIQSFQRDEFDLDFSESGTVTLLAGETSVNFDNYINSLDISTQIRTLYTNDNKNDLNRDHIVNSLDLSNTIYNLYEKGD